MLLCPLVYWWWLRVHIGPKGCTKPFVYKRLADERVCCSVDLTIIEVVRLRGRYHALCRVVTLDSQTALILSNQIQVSSSKTTALLASLNMPKSVLPVGVRFL